MSTKECVRPPPKKPKVDLVMEMLCCLPGPMRGKDYAALVRDMVEDLGLSSQRGVGHLVNEAVGLGFTVSVHNGDHGRELVLAAHDWPWLQRECEDYWQRVHGGRR